MKKSLIAAAGATLAVSAMPVLGVFADVTDSFTDTIEVTVQDACIFASEVTDGQSTTITDVNGRTFTKGDAKPGELLEFGDESGMIGDEDGKTVKFYCTNDGTAVKNVAYTITAIGGDGATASTTMAAAKSGNTGIATNLNENGETSGWAMKITSANKDSNFASYHVIPSSSTTVAAGNTTTGASGAVAFSPAYRVYIGTAQASDTYTGQVTYTLSATLTNQ